MSDHIFSIRFCTTYSFLRRLKIHETFDFEKTLRSCVNDDVQSKISLSESIHLTGKSDWVRGRYGDDFAVEYFICIQSVESRSDIIAKLLLEKLRAQLASIGLSAEVGTPTKLQLYRQVQ